jgi:hypothetical protein
LRKWFAPGLEVPSTCSWIVSVGLLRRRQLVLDRADVGFGD